MSWLQHVPLGTFIGQHFGWQMTFLAVALLGVVAFAGIALLVPNNIAGSAPAGLLAQLSVLQKPRLLLVYAMTALGYGGTFIAFTYLAPILEGVSGFSSGSVGLVMLVYGVSVAFGNVPGLQVYVVRRAERDAPHAVDVASGLNIAAFNVGIALGAWSGGVIVAHLGLMATPWIGALVVVGALLLTTLAGRLDRREAAPASTRAPAFH
jgi:predicted MFS family arabinose efflux permease